jgi:hypothetical protein
MYCNKCGKQITDNSVFCNFCGEKIEIIESEDSNKKANEKPLAGSTEQNIDSETIQNNIPPEQKEKIYTNTQPANVPNKVYKRPISIVLVVLLGIGFFQHFLVYQSLVIMNWQ